MDKPKRKFHFSHSDTIIKSFENPFQALGWVLLQDIIKRALVHQDIDDGIFLLHPKGGLREYLHMFGFQIDCNDIQSRIERNYTDLQLDQIYTAAICNKLLIQEVDHIGQMYFPFYANS